MSELMRAAQRPFFALAFLALAIACLAYARDELVPIAVAVLLWFLINALAMTLRRTPRVGILLTPWLAQALAVGVFAALMVLAGRVIAANIGELGRGFAGGAMGTAMGGAAGGANGEEIALAKIEAWARWIGIEADITAAELFELVGLDRLIGWSVSTLRTLVSDASLVFLYVMFLLIDQRFYDAKLRALLPDAGRRARVTDTLDRIAAETRAYLWLMSLISFGVALVTYAACAAVGLPGAGFWGFVAFLLNFVPTIGSILAVVLPCVYGLITLTDPVSLVVLIGVLAGTQFVAGEVVLPRLMGDRLNLSSVVILLTLVVWGAIWGPAGMFLAIPITVILVLICARFEATRPIAVLLSKDGRLPDE